MNDKEFVETLFGRPVEEIYMGDDAEWRGLKEVIERSVDEKT